MAKIYGLPSNLEPHIPSYKYPEPIGDYHHRIDVFISSFAEVLKKRCPMEFVGETISFPVADGKAIYMVASMKPLSLVHIPIGDAWQFQYIDRLTAKDIKDQITREKALKALFSKKS